MTTTANPTQPLSAGTDIASDGSTTHAGLAAWVAEVAALTTPDRIHWVHRLRAGVDRADRRARRRRHLHPAQPGHQAQLVPLRLRPQRRRPGRGPHLHLLGRREGRRSHQQLDGAGRDEGDHDRPLPRVMRGRTMYVIPFVMGHLDAEQPMFGVEITDSAYVVASMRVMARCGTEVLRRIEELDASFVPAPALGRRAARPRPAGRRLAVQRHQVHRPVPRGADDLVLRLGLRRQRPAGQEVLLAAHRLGHRPRRGLAGRAHAHPQADHPEKQSYYVAAAFPSACGKTNLAMLEPDHPGLGGADPRRRHRLDEVRRGRPPVRREPRVRLLRRRARHQREDQPQRDAHHREGQLGLHQRRPDRRRRHLVGGPGERAGPRHRLEGQRLDPRGRPERRPVQPPQQPLLHPDRAVPDPRPRVRRPAAACRSRRSSSAAAARRRSRW